MTKCCRVVNLWVVASFAPLLLLEKFPWNLDMLMTVISASWLSVLLKSLRYLRNSSRSIASFAIFNLNFFYLVLILFIRDIIFLLSGISLDDTWNESSSSSKHSCSLSCSSFCSSFWWMHSSSAAIYFSSRFCSGFSLSYKVLVLISHHLLWSKCWISFLCSLDLWRYCHIGQNCSCCGPLLWY